MAKINKMVYFMLAVAVFVVASFMTEPDLAATGETAGAEAIEINVNDNPLISSNKTLNDIKEGDSVAVRYSAIDIENLATDIKIIPANR